MRSNAATVCLCAYQECSCIHTQINQSLKGWARPSLRNPRQSQNMDTHGTEVREVC